jgi:hypothetical protein
MRRVVQMRTVTFDNAFEVAYFTHELFSTSRPDKDFFFLVR